jgi:hypothetical protein
VDISLDERTRKLIEASQDPNEIAQLCLKAGIAAGGLTKDAFGNVVVAGAQPSIVSQKVGVVDFDNRDDVSNANPDPQFLEFRK